MEAWKIAYTFILNCDQFWTRETSHRYTYIVFVPLYSEEKGIYVHKMVIRVSYTNMYSGLVRGTQEGA